MSENINIILNKYFGFKKFRPLQEEIINTIIEKRDTVVLMPTGGGKSLCFQIPALAMPGVCIVISPLIALMRDQVEGMKANGIAAYCYNSTLSASQEFEVIEMLKNDKIKLLYISAEKVLTEDFISIMNQININLFAIDEAHCISAWGHDFRPEYTKLSQLKKLFPETPFTALTATADKISRKDIITQLDLKDAKVFISSFNRPNIKLEVRTGKDRINQIINFLNNHPEEAGIIYCLSRKQTENIAHKLRDKNFNADFYHAGMSADERDRVQNNFSNDNIQIICATIAFGMGIDKSNIRWVIHYNLPKSMENYYQEIGRAGRDGAPANAILFYSYGDIFNLRKFAEESGQPEIQQMKLDRMQEFAESFICRRRILLSYFNENMSENCGNCDICNNPPKTFDGTIIAQKALSAIVRTEQKVASGMLIDILRGALTLKIQQNNYHKIKTYGKGKDIKYQKWQQYIMQLIQLGYIEIAYDQNNALKLTDTSSDVLYNKKKVELVDIEQNSIKRTRPKERIRIDKSNLKSTLLEIRRKLAIETGVPPYIIFNDNTIQQIAEQKPRNKAAFMKIDGVNEVKYKKFASYFLKEIDSFFVAEDRRIAKKYGGTALYTLAMYKKNISINDIAKHRNITTQTVITHLIKLAESGTEVNLRKLVKDEEIKIIQEAIEAVGSSEKLKPIYDYLNEEFDYEKIKIVVCLNKQ